MTKELSQKINGQLHKSLSKIEEKCIEKINNCVDIDEVNKISEEYEKSLEIEQKEVEGIKIEELSEEEKKQIQDSNEDVFFIFDDPDKISYQYFKEEQTYNDSKFFIKYFTM